MVHPTIQNLIFDLGGVILDLHTNRTHEAFARAGHLSVEEVRAMISTTSLFNDHEKGLLSDDEFRNGIRTMLKKNLSDEEIDAAWNAMLGGIPLERLQLLKRLRNTYRVFLLSNTNNIHLPNFSRMVKEVSGESSLGAFFEKAYYSHELKMRKPDKEIYQHVLKQHQLVPEFTLFLDDHPPNLQGAAETGIKTFHVQNPQLMMSLFHES